MRAFLNLGLATTALLAVQAHAGKGTPVLPKGTVARVQEPSLGNGWQLGTIDTDAIGCTMVFLSDPKSKYKSVALHFGGPIEMKQDGKWVKVPVRELLPKMPAVCREGSND